MEVIHPILGKFVLSASIGEGTFASVYTARHPRLRQPIAIKIFNDQFPVENVYEAFEISNSIRHPLICQEFDIFQAQKGETCILMEYINGMTLLDYANTFGPLSNTEIRSFTAQLIIALDFIHKNNIIHRDLKCENILIDHNHNIRIIDFGFSISDLVMHETTCGSPSYLAPEIIEGKPYGTSIDIWSLGIVLYAITFGQLPFENQNLRQLFLMICQEEPSYQSNQEVHEDLIDLLKRMLTKDPKSRITTEQIKLHPYFTRDEKGKQYIFNTNIFTDMLKDNFPILSLVKQLKLPDDQYIQFMQDLQQGNQTADTMLYQFMKKSYLSNVKLPELSKQILVPKSEKVKLSRSKDFVPMISFSNRMATSSYSSSSPINACNTNAPSDTTHQTSNHAEFRKAHTVSMLHQYKHTNDKPQHSDTQADQGSNQCSRLLFANPFIKANSRSRRYSTILSHATSNDLKQPSQYSPKSISTKLPNLFSPVSSL